MPCTSIKVRYKRQQRTIAKPMALDKQEPFYRAAKDYVKQQGKKGVVKVEMIAEDVLSIEMRNFATITVRIPDLHDMADRYVPHDAPDGPISAEQLLSNFKTQPAKAAEVAAATEREVVYVRRTGVR